MQTDAPRNARVLELGAGVGLASLASCELGAAQVDATDGDANFIRILRENVAGSNVRVSVLQWGNAHEQYGESHVDLVLASDLIYDPDQFESLLHCLRVLNPERVLLSYRKRNEDHEDAFFAGLTFMNVANKWRARDASNPMYEFNRKGVLVLDLRRCH